MTAKFLLRLKQPLKKEKMKEIMDHLDKLTIVIKLSTFVGTKPALQSLSKSPQDSPNGKMEKRTSSLEVQGLWLLAPSTTVKDPSSITIVGEWGHTACECRSKGNIPWRELNKGKFPLGTASKDNQNSGNQQFPKVLGGRALSQP